MIPVKPTKGVRPLHEPDCEGFACLKLSYDRLSTKRRQPSVPAKFQQQLGGIAQGPVDPGSGDAFSDICY